MALLSLPAVGAALNLGSETPEPSFLLLVTAHGGPDSVPLSPLFCFIDSASWVVLSSTVDL